MRTEEKTREEGRDKQNKWKCCSLHYAAGVLSITVRQTAQFTKSFKCPSQRQTAGYYRQFVYRVKTQSTFL